jgi:two-component system KDP operon response regulator KdpE
MRIPERSSISEHSACVLVVDDNDAVRRMLRVALETAGFDVVEAGTQLQLQRRLTVTRPDALVLDLQRSHADGLTLLIRMRARQTLCSVPIVFLAGCDDDEFRRQATCAGADWFGVRPLRMLELQTHLRNLIRNGRQTTAHTGAAPQPGARLSA